MRSFALLVILASGCSLYFDHREPGSQEAPPPDARPARPDASEAPPDADPTPDPGPGAVNAARCEDGQLYAVETSSSDPEQPGHQVGRLIGRCPGACRSAAVFCSSPECTDAAQALCDAAISPGATCPLDGLACEGTGSIDCPEATACSVAVPGSACTCANGAYDCTQVTPAAATQAQLVGRWRGLVTTPAGFFGPYPITLWIYPDGTYWPECGFPYCSAFYYGGDGPSPRRKITILSASEGVGAWADIAIDFGYSPPLTGALTALSVDATTLRFTFSPSWFSCGLSLEYTLSRY